MKSYFCAILFTIVLGTGHAGASYASWRNDEDHCEVCLKVIRDIKLQLSAVDKKDINRVEGYINHHCSSKNRNLRADERKFCRHLIPIVRQISMPLVHGVKPIDMCKKMHRVDPAICDYKYNTVMPEEYKKNKEKYKKFSRSVKRPQKAPTQDNNIQDNSRDEL